MTKQTIKRQILDALKKRPMSSAEVARMIGDSPQSAAKRLCGLHKEGAINKFGVNESKGGRGLIVWGVGESTEERGDDGLTSRITAALDSGDMAIDQITEHCRTSRYKAINAIKRLIKSGKVVKVRPNKGSMPAIYGLKDRERKAIKPAGVDRVSAERFLLYKPKKGEVVWNGVRC